MASSSSSQDFVENGSSSNSRAANKFKRSVHSLSSASLRKKSDLSVISRVRIGVLRRLLTNIQEVVLGTKLSVLFPAVPLAFIAYYCKFGQAWTFIISLLALTPLAERVSFLTEQIAFYTGPTVGGLLNATCGNATELIIGLFALFKGKIDVVKYSLLGSILSNLLLVLGTSLFFGGIANVKKEQNYNRKQADVNILLLLMGLLCHVLSLMFHYISNSNAPTAHPDSLQMSRAISLVMLVAYCTYLFFQLKTHRHFFEAHPVGNDDEGDDVDTEEPVIGFWSAFAWLVGMTVLIALLSEFVVGTIEDASSSWGISISFLSIILLPIVGNAAEHAGAIIFALKDKLDISLGVALGSATQISIFVVPLTVTIAWIGGIEMDLNFDLLETGSLALSILATAFTLQDGTSHYMKGLILVFCYIVISLCFFFFKTPLESNHFLESQGASTGAFLV